MLGLRSVLVEVVSRSVLVSQDIVHEFAQKNGLTEPGRAHTHARVHTHYGAAQAAAAAPASSVGNASVAQVEPVATTFVDAFDPTPHMTDGESESAQLLLVAESMCGLRGLSPLHIADRKWRLQSYPACWVGSEAVAWLQKNKWATTARGAVAIGTRLVGTRLASKVESSAPLFHDAALFYKFIHPQLRWPLLVMSESRDTQLPPEMRDNHDLSRQPSAFGLPVPVDQEKKLWDLLTAERVRLGVSQADIPNLLHDMLTASTHSFERQHTDKGGGGGERSYGVRGRMELPLSQTQLNTPSSSGAPPPLISPSSLPLSSYSGSSNNVQFATTSEVHAALRRTGHFKGSDLIRFFKRHHVAHCTRDAMILATYLLKLPLRAPHLLPTNGTVPSEGFFLPVGVDRVLSPEVLKHVTTLARNDATAAAYMSNASSPRMDSSHNQAYYGDQHQQQYQQQQYHGASASSSLIQPPPRPLPCQHGGVSVGSPSPFTDPPIIQHHVPGGGEFFIPSNPSNSISNPSVSGSDDLHQRGSWGHKGESQSDNGLPSYRAHSHSLKESPSMSYSSGYNQHGPHGSHNNNNHLHHPTPSSTASLLSFLSPAASAYHHFLSSPQHIASIPFSFRDTFKNGDMWYKLCVLPPQAQLLHHHSMGGAAMLPGMMMSGDSVTTQVMPFNSGLGMPAAAMGGVGGLMGGGGGVMLPPMAVPRLGLGAIHRDPHTEASLPSLVRHHYFDALALRMNAQQMPHVHGPQHYPHIGGSAAAAAAAATDMASIARSTELTWEFAQSFGDDTQHYDADEDADDLVTAVTFHPSGELLAIGDKAGRVSIVKQTDTHGTGRGEGVPLEYAFFTEFQSHTPDFDALRSMQIEPRINALEWWGQTEQLNTQHLMLLTANDKTVKLWRVATRPPEANRSFASFVQSKRQREREAAAGSGGGGRGSGGKGGMFGSASRFSGGAGGGMGVYPNASSTDDAYDADSVQLGATLKCSYANAHGYNIHSVGTNSDGLSFFSADEIRINLWHATRPDEAQIIVDLTPPPGRDIQEMVTVARFHPTQCNILMYASSTGILRLGDLRAHTVLDREMCQTLASHHARGLYSEITDSILDARFSPCGRYILSRDYLTLRIWDTHHPAAPIHAVSVHPHMDHEDRLQACFYNDAIFDSFHCAISNDGLHIVSGTYSNSFTLHNVLSRHSVTIRATDESREPRFINEHYTYHDGSIGGQPAPLGARHPPPRPAAVAGGARGVGGRGVYDPAAHFDQLAPGHAPRYNEKMLKCAWHPRVNAVAVAGPYKLYLYQATVPGMQRAY